MTRWTLVGPSCAPNTFAGDEDDDKPGRRTAVTGRVRVIAVDPRAPAATLFAGTDQGGLWRTLDGGQIWEPTTDIGITVVDLAVTPSGRLWVAGALNPKLWHVSRSEDSGASWAESSFFHDTQLTVMLPDPRDDRFVFVGTTGGPTGLAALFHGPHTEPDAPDLWVKIRNGLCTSLAAELDATTGQLRLYAAFDADWIFAGDPTSLSVLPFPAGLLNVARTKLVVAPSDPSVVYVAVGSSTDTEKLQGLFRSSNRGNAWSAIGPLRRGGDKMGKQIHHNLTLAVHPRDPDVFLLGEVHLWRSSDGGQSFEDVGNRIPPIHVDQMSLAFDPAAGAGVSSKPGDHGILWCSNDGGVFLSTDGGRSFRHRNRGLTTLMVYELAHHPVVPAVILAGTQDNGALRATGNAGWQESTGGDVTNTGIHQALRPEPPTPDDPPPNLAHFRTWYSAMFSTLSRSRFSGEPDGSPLIPRDQEAWHVIATDSTANRSPILPDRLDPKVVYTGNIEVLRLIDDPDLSKIDDPDLIDAKLLKLKTSLLKLTNDTVSALAMSRDGTVIYVGTRLGNVSRLVRAGELWFDQTVPVPTGSTGPPGGAVITSIAVHPTDRDRVIISHDQRAFAGGHGAFLWRSNNAGGDWFPIDFDPNLAVPDSRDMRDNVVRALAIDPVAPHALYVACDSGVFRFDVTSTTGSPWSNWWKGLPRVSVRHIAIHERARLLRAGTHGRGIWERPLDASDTDPEPTTPAVRVYLRTHRYDDGRRAPLNESGEDPIDSRKKYGPLDGADIKVDIDPVLSGSFQKPAGTVDYTPDGAVDHIGFQALENRTPRRSRDARIYVQVQNAGPDIAEQVKVRVFWSERKNDGIAPLTQAVWAAFAADNEPASGDWHAVAAPQIVSKLRPAVPQVARFTWSVPGGPERVTLLAIVGTPAARAEPVGATDLLLRVHSHFSLKDVSLDEPLYKIIGVILVGVGLAAAITYTLVKDPPEL